MATLKDRVTPGPAACQLRKDLDARLLSAANGFPIRLTKDEAQYLMLKLQPLQMKDHRQRISDDEFRELARTMQFKDIATKLGWSSRRVTYVAKRLGIKSPFARVDATPRELERLRDMLQAGCKMVDIAAELKRSIGFVEKYTAKMRKSGEFHSRRATEFGYGAAA